MSPFAGFRCQNKRTMHVGTVFRADRETGVIVNMEAMLPYVVKCSWDDFLVTFGPAPAAEVVDLTTVRERR